MEEGTSFPHLIRFAEYQLDSRTGELCNGHAVLRLPKKPLQILLLLLDRPGGVVTREELRTTLWPDHTFVDFEDSLNHAVRRLREPLGDSAENPRFIETLPGLGYRFIAPVEASECPGSKSEGTGVTLESPQASGTGQAVVEAPRAPAGLQLTPAPLPYSRSAIGTSPLKRHLAIGLAVIGAVVVLAVFLLALNVAGLRGRLQGRRATPTLDPKRVAVAIFENRTGDPSLDNLGKMTAEALSQGLSQIETIKVVPSGTVFELTASATAPRRPRDPARALAEATGSGLVVSGEYYLQGQTLQIRAGILDQIANKVVCAVEPGTGPREKATEVVENVRRQVIDVVAAQYLNPLRDLLIEEVKPPPFEAQKEFLVGSQLHPSDLPAAIAHYRRAIELDPDFANARLWLAGALGNQGDFVGAKKELENISEVRAGLTPPGRRRLDWARAMYDGRIEEQYSALRDIVRLVPANPIDWAQLGWTALYSNHPRATVEALRKPVRWDLIIKPGAPLGAVSVRALTAALHQLGEHQEELKEARQGGGIYPDLLNSYAYEARALVALGRLDEVDKLSNEIQAMPSHWSYPGCCLPRATPGYVMLSAAEELRAHGYREASLKMADRAVDWYGSRIGEEGKREDTRSGLGDSLYLGERWKEAKAVFAALAVRHPDNIRYKGRLGALEARRGDRSSALRIAEELRRRGYGDLTFLSARIITLLGDKDRAVALLREAVAQGAGTNDEGDAYGYGFVYRHSMDLESLRGYPPFEELIKPKE